MKLKNGNLKNRIELTLDLINARVSMNGKQRNEVREVLTEQIMRAVKEERAMINYELGLLTGRTSDSHIQSAYVEIANMINARSESEKKGE